MSRWISDIAAKARSIARWAARSAAPRPRTPTTVPRTGRARSMAGGGEHERIDGKEPPHPVGNMAARERRTRDILDIAIQPQRRAALFADELAPPRRQLHFATVGLVVVENFKLP